MSKIMMSRLITPLAIFVVFVLMGLFIIYATWTFSQFYFPTEEDVGYLVDTVSWKPLSWLLNGNKYHLYETVEFFYWRPFTLFLSHIYLNYISDSWAHILWLNVVLQSFSVLAVSKIIKSLSITNSVITTMSLAGLCIFANPAFVASSLSQYNWLQFNLATCLFLFALLSYMSGNFLCYAALAVIAFMTKDNVILLVVVTTILSLTNSRHLLRKTLIFHTFILVAYFGYRVAIGSISFGYLVSHSSDYSPDALYYVSNMIMACPETIKTAYPNSTFIFLAINVLLLFFFSIIVWEAKDHTLSSKNRTFTLVISIVVLFLILLPFVKAHWKVELLTLMGVLFIKLFTLPNVKKWALLGGGVLFLTGATVKYLDYSIELESIHHSEFNGQTEMKQIVAGLKRADLAGVERVLLIPSLNRASPSMIGELFGIRSMKLSALDEACQAGYRARFEELYEANLLLQSSSITLKSAVHSSCNQVVMLDEGDGVVFVDVFTKSTYVIFKKKGVIRSVHLTSLGESEIIEHRVTVELNNAHCAAADAFVIRWGGKAFKMDLTSAASRKKYYREPCTLSVPLPNQGNVTIQVLKKSNQVLHELHLNKNLIAN